MFQENREYIYFCWSVNIFYLILMKESLQPIFYFPIFFFFLASVDLKSVFHALNSIIQLKKPSYLKLISQTSLVIWFPRVSTYRRQVSWLLHWVGTSSKSSWCLRLCIWNLHKSLKKERNFCEDKDQVLDCDRSTQAPKLADYSVPWHIFNWKHFIVLSILHLSTSEIRIIW